MYNGEKYYPLRLNQYPVIYFNLFFFFSFVFPLFSLNMDKTNARSRSQSEGTEDRPIELKKRRTTRACKQKKERRSKKGIKLIKKVYRRCL
jgi:hypothetical protein